MSDMPPSITNPIVSKLYIQKPFAWSYSRLKNFEACPYRHQQVDILKTAKEDEQSEALLWGNLVHTAMADRCNPKKLIPLPVGMEQFEKWAARATTGTPGTKLILVEQKLAINENFGSCRDYFAKDVWFRSVGDLIKIIGPVALLIDWKTGKILEDSQQLALGAACVFAAYPQVQKVRSVFAWLKDDCETSDIFDRDSMATMWRGIWPRIESLKNAHETGSYPAKLNRLCRSWCPVEKCKHHGESY